MNKLLGEDIFDITTTGMPFYDAMIQKGHIAGNRDPVDYFRDNKGLVFEVVWMTPEEYLLKSYEIHKEVTRRYMSAGNRILITENRAALQMSFEDYIRNVINSDLIEEYKERTLEGSKMPIPVLDYSNMSQEGRHRSIVAMELDVEKIPVLVVRSYEE